jgi:hypothetical protein
MTSTHEANLDIPMLPDIATHAHILPDLQTHSLISLGQLCDSGCTATIDQETIDIFYQNEIILKGLRSPETTLWHIECPIDKHPQIHYANNVIGNNTSANLVAFMHAAFFSPVLSTLYKALKRGYITNVPGLTDDTLKKHPPQSFAMVKGHLNQTRKNIRSTKLTSNDYNVDVDEFHPPQLTIDDKQHANYCYASLFEPTGKMYSDQTGRMVTPSTKGNNYIFIMYDYDSNAILAEPIRNRKAESILEAYKKVHTTLLNKGMSPKIQIIDNECSQLLKDYMQQQHIKYQLVAPGQHRANAAERAIQTFKNHFIAGLCSVDEHFPINLWDRLLPQAVITLNLLRGSRINPGHSAWAQLFGDFDFNATPMAPPGIRVLIHEKPDKRATFAPHATDGWYVGPALEHYRCYRVYVWETQAERTTDTLSWFPTKVTLPTSTSEARIGAALQDVVTELQKPRPPFSNTSINDSHTATLTTITQMLSKIICPDDVPEFNDIENIDDISPSDIEMDDPNTSQRVNNTVFPPTASLPHDTPAAQRVPFPPISKQAAKHVTFEQLVPLPLTGTYTHPKVKGMIDASIANQRDIWVPRNLNQHINISPGIQPNMHMSLNMLKITAYMVMQSILTRDYQQNT